MIIIHYSDFAKNKNSYELWNASSYFIKHNVEIFLIYRLKQSKIDVLLKADI